MKRKTSWVQAGKKLLFTKRAITFTLATLLFLALLYFIPSHVDWNARVAISVMAYGLLLWAMEPIPLGMTSVLTLVLLLFLNGTTIDTALSGFASSAVFLIIAGMMIAKAVNATSLMERVTYAILAKWGKSPKGIFAGMFLLMQVQAFFIPATAVRAQLITPVVLSILRVVGAGRESNFSKLMLIGTAFAGNISGTAILTAAIGNILTIEILQSYLGTSLSYLDWFIYALPIWLLLIITIPIIVWFCYPPEDYSFSDLQKEMKEKQTALGKFSSKEIKCLLILTLTVILWMTQALHGYHPTIPALLAVVLLAFPRIGVVKWNKIIDVNFDMVLLIGSTLSLGFVLIETGAIDLLAGLFTADIVQQAFSNPWLALCLVVILSQIYHLGVTNVSTAVVTLMPVLIGLSLQVGIDPVIIAFASSVTMLFGYILVVETMPNVVIHGTGLIKQRDFYLPGIVATVVTTIITLLIAFTWWRWLGFWP